MLTQFPHRERILSQRLTRLGVHVVFLGGFAMFGGAIRGFNLLLVVAAVLTAALLIQWRWGRRWIDAVTVRRRMPVEVHAGQSFQVPFRIGNRSRWLSLWMLRVEDRIERCGEPLAADREAASIGTCSVAVVAAGRSETTAYECLITERGPYRFGPVTLQSTFPFFLFQARVTFSGSDELVVLPRLLDMHPQWRRWLTHQVGGQSDSVARSGWSEGDFFGLRQWQTGDSLKWIHWRTTARLPDPAVRQFEQRRSVALCLIVDAYGRGAEDRDAAELAISLAATIVTNLTRSPASKLVVGVAGAAAEVVVSESSPADRRNLLAGLAKAVVSPEPQLAQTVAAALHRGGRSTDVLMISPRSQAELSAALKDEHSPAGGSTIRSDVRFVNVRDPEFEPWISGGGR